MPRLRINMLTIIHKHFLSLLPRRKWLTHGCITPEGEGACIEAAEAIGTGRRLQMKRIQTDPRLTLSRGYGARWALLTSSITLLMVACGGQPASEGSAAPADPVGVPLNRYAMLEKHAALSVNATIRQALLHFVILRGFVRPAGCPVCRVAFISRRGNYPTA
jgi:hypothetical protein